MYVLSSLNNKQTPLELHASNEKVAAAVFPASGITPRIPSSFLEVGGPLALEEQMTEFGTRGILKDFTRSKLTA